MTDVIVVHNYATTSLMSFATDDLSLFLSLSRPLYIYLHVDRWGGRFRIGSPVRMLLSHVRPIALAPGELRGTAIAAEMPFASVLAQMLAQ